MKKIILAFTFLFFVFFESHAQVTPTLGAAEMYTVLAGSAVINTGSTTKLDLNLGVSPGNTVTGITAAMVKGTQEIANTNAATAQTDLATAYNIAATGQTVTQNLSGQNLGGKTLTPGVYKFNNNAALTGTLTLDSDSNPNGIFIFQVDGNLSFANNAAVNLLATTQPARSMNIYWQVAGSVTIGSSTNLRGTIMANQNITASTGNILGRLLSKSGTVSLDNTIITLPTDLTVSVAISPGVTNPAKYYIGETVTYTIIARNNGPNNDVDVKVENVLHAGLTYISANVPAGTVFTPPTSTLPGVWKISNFPKGTTQTLQIVTEINTQASSNTSFYASIEGKALDEINPNNHLVSFCVVPENAGAISGPASVCVGKTGNFSIAAVPGATSYVWNLPSGWSYSSGDGTTNSISVIAGATAGQITVKAKNSCEESNLSVRAIAVNTVAPDKPGEIRASNNTANVCVGGGSITFSIDPVTGANSYEWKVPAGWTIKVDNNTSIIVEATASAVAGFVEVAARNGCGPSDYSKLAITPSVAPPAAATDITGESAPCIGKEVTYTANGATGATTYTWTIPTGWTVNGSATGASIKVVVVGTTAGIVKVAAVNACGISSETSLNVAPITTTAPGAITGPVNPCADPNAEYTYSISPVAGASTYLWRVAGGITISGGQGTTSLKIKVPASVVSATIFVSSFNNCGQSTEQQITLTPLAKPNTPQAITGATPQPCVGTSNLVYSIAAVSGATSYIWTVPGDWQIIGNNDGTSITVKAGSVAGNITVAAINTCGTGTPRTLAVSPTATVPAAPLAISGNKNPCAGQTSVAYSVDAVTGTTGYTWTVPAGWTITSGQNTVSILVTVGATAGDIKVTANNNCGVGNATVLAVSPSTIPSPAPGQITGNIPVPCINQTNVTYSVAAVSGATSYKWMVTGDWKITSDDTGTSVTVTVGSAAGTISVKAVNGCGESPASTLNVMPATTAPAMPLAITGKSSVCINQTNLTYSVAAVAGANAYTWSVPAGWTIISGQGTTSVVVNAGTQPGTIGVQAVNNCSASVARTVAVAVSTTPPGTPGAITGTTTICAGQTNLIFTIPTVAGATSYTWTLPTGWTITAGENTAAITVTAGTTSGKIKVKAINGCGESTESEITIAPTVGAPADINPIQASNPSVCAEQAGLTYFITPVIGAATYNWQLPAGWVITSGQGTTIITVTAGSTAGNITVTAFNNCGAKSASLTITPGTKPAAPLAIQGTNVPCAGSTGNTYSVAAIPGATAYTWAVPAGWTITSGQGTTNIIVATSSDKGEITVTADNACGPSAAKTLAVTPASVVPATPGAITGNSSVCSSNNILTYAVNAVENASQYTWTVPNGWSLISGQGTNAIQVKASTNTGGTFTVYAENGCGISAVSILPVSVTGQAPLQPGTIAGNANICAGEKEVNYTVGGVSGAASYAWAVPAGWTITSGQGSTSIKVAVGSSAGNITVVAVNGCGNSLESVLPVAPASKPEEPKDIKGEKNQCANNVGAIYSIADVEGATSYKWNVPSDWSITAGQGTTAITVTVGKESGNISVEAINKCGSTESSLLIVTSINPPTAEIGGIRTSDSGLICSGQTGLTYTIDPVKDATSYIWTVPAGWVITAGQGTTSITATAGAGSGDILVKAVNGCGESKASNLFINPSQAASVKIGDITGEAAVCFGQKNLAFTIAAVSGATNYTWEVPQGWVITAGQGTPTVTVTASGKAGEVSVVASNTCATSLAATKGVTINPTPLSPAQIKDLSNPCSGLAYSVDLIDGANSYSWLLPEGWTITSGEGTNLIKVKAPAGSKNGQITVVANTNSCNSSAVSMEANPELGNSELVIANVFSPNGDGDNDKWEIANILNYKENDLTIINRWGSEVYRYKGYQNNWDGSGLSAGTYFYVLKVKVCDGSYQTHKGYVMIMR